MRSRLALPRHGTAGAGEGPGAGCSPPAPGVRRSDRVEISTGPYARRRRGNHGLAGWNREEFLASGAQGSCRVLAKTRLEQQIMTEKQHEPGDDLLRALEILNAADASGDDDPEIEAALRTLARLLPSASPRQDFSGRVIASVQQAPLSPGRRKLRSRRRAIITSLTGAAAAAVTGTLLWTTGFLRIPVAEIFLLVVQSGTLAVRSVTFMLDMLRFVDRAARVLTAVLTSREMLSVVGTAAFLSLLSVAALRRLVSSSQPLRQRESMKC